MAGRGRAVAILLLIALSAAGCTRAVSPDIGPKANRDLLAAPAMPAQALIPPARLGLVRLVDGRPTPIPAAERVRMAGVLAQVNARLLYPITPVPLALPPTAGLAPGAQDVAGADVDALLARAGAVGIDAVLVYALSTRVESDRMVAALADLPLVGGIVPRTVSTEAHGTASAVLLDPRSRSVIGRARARMTDRVIAGLRVTGGDPRKASPEARYAMLHTLAPRLEDLLVSAVSDGYRP